MKQEQKDLVIENVMTGIAAGMDSWWEIFVAANRALEYTPDDSLAKLEQSQMEAWFALFMEAHAGLVDESEEYTVDMFYDMISQKFKNKQDEIEAIRRLISKCESREMFLPEVEQCKKYGY